MNLLHDQLITVQLHDGSLCQQCLPEVMAALASDQVQDFPGLRPHQRTAWHSLLVQLGALCCLEQEANTLSVSPVEWRDWLLSLTPTWPNGDAWALTATDLSQPAFLQAPEPTGSLADFKEITCPDDLDILASSKNHDVKQSTMVRASPEHWLFALVTLQTQQGFLGAGNYGVSRMNGGFSNRPFFGVRPGGGLGRWLQRDIRELLLGRAQLLEDYPAYPANGGVALLWLATWDGSTSVRPPDLDPWYVEICRRVRFEARDGLGIVAHTTGSKVARIDTKGLLGRTGDPWAPLVGDGSDFKALTTQRHTFSYRSLVPLLFPFGEQSDAVRRAPLQIVSDNDDLDGLRIVVSALVRGQGKTEGFFEREIPVSRATRRFLISVPTDAAANLASERVKDASALSREVLFPAALALFTGAPTADERKRDDDTAKDRTRAVCMEFERAVDQDFFEELTTELDAVDDAAAQRLIRDGWLQLIADRARRAFSAAMDRAPDSAARHYRTKARSLLLFDAKLHRHLGTRLKASASSSPLDQQQRNTI